MVVRAGITTGLMELGPSEANWFLARNAGEGETVTSDQFLLEETRVSPSMYLTPSFP